MATPLKYADLAGQVNQFMTGEVMKPYLANLPNYANLVGANSDLIGNQMAGKLTDEFKWNLRSDIAQQNVGNGIAGSPAGDSAYFRALGTNMLAYQQQGLDNFSRSRADTPVPEVANPWSILGPEILANQALGAAKGGSRGTGPATRTGPSFQQRPAIQRSGIGGGGGYYNNQASDPTAGYQQQAMDVFQNNYATGFEQPYSGNSSLDPSYQFNLGNNPNPPSYSFYGNNFDTGFSGNQSSGSDYFSVNQYGNADTFSVPEAYGSMADYWGSTNQYSQPDSGYDWQSDTSGDYGSNYSDWFE